jgi:hypothetical protein
MFVIFNATMCHCPWRHWCSHGAGITNAQWIHDVSHTWTFVQLYRHTRCAHKAHVIVLSSNTKAWISAHGLPNSNYLTSLYWTRFQCSYDQSATRNEWPPWYRRIHLFTWVSNWAMLGTCSIVHEDVDSDALILIRQLSCWFGHW